MYWLFVYREINTYIYTDTYIYTNRLTFNLHRDNKKQKQMILEKRNNIVTLPIKVFESHRLDGLLPCNLTIHHDRGGLMQRNIAAWPNCGLQCNSNRWFVSSHSLTVSRIASCPQVGVRTKERKFEFRPPTVGPYRKKGYFFSWKLGHFSDGCVSVTCGARFWHRIAPMKKLKCSPV